jgi:diguanylate cyclase (GGDEF)-like protein
LERINGAIAGRLLVDRVPSLTTLLAIAVFTPALAGCLLLLSWLQHRSIAALGVWGSGFLMSSIATTLIVIARGIIPNFWSIVVGNALLAAAYGILWCGARKFEGRKIPILLALAGVVLWLVACSIGAIYARPEARAAVMAAIGIGYTLLAVRELWLGRGDGVWRWPIIMLLLGHAVSIPIHIPVAGAWKRPDPADVDLLTFMIFETAFVSICGAYLFGGLVSNRIVARYQHASLTDPLTGITNRRGFFQMAERLLVRTRFANQPVALMMFDLDHFKAINDEFGHGTGDEVLIAFCRLAIAQLRSNDLFGRIGGEEFAALLPNTTHEDAVWLAERLRAAVESSSHRVGERTIRATVSVGVVTSSNDTTADLAELLREADQTLYRAKDAGRNCVKALFYPAKRVSVRRPDEPSMQKRTAA